MKKLLFINLFVILVLAGCVSTQSNMSAKNVTVDENNVFHSVIPKLGIQVAKEIRYLDGLGRNQDAPLTHSVNTSNNSSNVYFFVDPENKEISKPIFVYINIEKLTGNRVYWNPIDFKTWKGVIDHGKEKINGRMYKYAYFQNIPISGNLIQQAFDSMKKNSIHMSHVLKRETIMTKFYTRRAGAKNNIIVYIGYTEGIDSNMGSWDNPKALSDEQKKFLKDFDKRCSENMAFLK